ncbi:MAG: SDR family oxidoreductase [Bdellovibrionaceae bacterium]|nr:SDR family oxidoreductase [Pseudobdellovibrionaceae bacterium]
MTSNRKIAFITGANRGIGFETARELAEKGVHVVLGARKEAEGKAAVQKLRDRQLEADFLVFDVTQPGDIGKAVAFFQEKFGRLDILVNNAGIMVDKGATSAITPQMLRQTFDVNFFAPVALTQAMLPLLKKSAAGRVVNLSSILGSLTLHTDPKSPIYDSKVFAYDSSKTALNAFTVHLAHELKDTKIKVNSAHPGWVKTEMGGADAPMELAEGGKTSVQLAMLEEDGPTGGFFHRGERLPW